ncbi:HD domain-containing protein [Bacillus sp. FJAT-50079]|uniref:HD domain-containing protein n=1 Tax=Bacillus sp. FJAT-50079 TaxID=2833577 RepID=UPI001BC9D3D7|nr:HD domain-containing protein [Bacillus sp. FJAT-50079]MBS4208148.1 HD domain-containing protein [Bacillus sp. FJAT-50079]
MEMLNIDINVPQEIKDGVVTSLPPINDIQNPELREKVIEAWALALALNGYERIEQIPGSGMPGAPIKGDQTRHILGVTYIAMAMKEALEKVFNEPLGVDSDMLLAAALCHDVGKPYEYNPENVERWKNDPRVSGSPALRHPTYGAYIAMVVGLPEEIVHVCGYHSPEGRFVRRSLSGTIVHYADDSFWFILENALNWDGQIPRL